MSLGLHSMKLNKGARKNKKRVGRGNASGHGTTGCRGQKGQKSRSGVSGLKRFGLKATLMKLPKNRGFRSLQTKNQVLNLSDINSNFKEGEVVNPQTLFKKGLIKSPKIAVKILGKGDLKLKDLKFEGVKMSASVNKNFKVTTKSKK